MTSSRAARRAGTSEPATAKAAPTTATTFPLDDLACVVHAIDEGLALQRMIDPDSVRPDLFLTAVDVLQRALGALAASTEPGAEPES